MRLRRDEERRRRRETRCVKRTCRVVRSYLVYQISTYFTTSNTLRLLHLRLIIDPSSFSPSSAFSTSFISVGQKTRFSFLSFFFFFFFNSFSVCLSQLLTWIFSPYFSPSFSLFPSLDSSPRLFNFSVYSFSHFITPPFSNFYLFLPFFNIPPILCTQKKGVYGWSWEFSFC